MYIVVKEAGRCVLPLLWFDTLEEAIKYCEWCDWELQDENDFYWYLSIKKDLQEVWDSLH